MPERLRARIDGELVTIIKVHGRGRKAKVDIRDRFGFPQETTADKLEAIDQSDPLATLKWGADDAAPNASRF